MGILNITPDSFYDGGKYKTESSVLLQVERMLTEGATFIDLGAYSSRPGADDINEKEELLRIAPILEKLIQKFPDILISVDTFRSTVAKECIAIGACMVNDISAGELDPNMFETMAELQVPYIVMHMPGNPKTMQKHTKYNDLVKEIIHYLANKVAALRKLGLNDIIIDPGFGFGKTMDQNYELLHKLELFHFMELPLMVGMSRKSMFYKMLDSSPEKALNATTVGHTVAVQKGCSLIRTHDVREAVETIRIVSKLKQFDL